MSLMRCMHDRISSVDVTLAEPEGRDNTLPPVWLSA